MASNRKVAGTSRLDVRWRCVTPAGTTENGTGLARVRSGSWRRLERERALRTSPLARLSDTSTAAPSATSILRTAGGPASIEHICVIETGDLAYTVSYERRTTSLDGGELHARALRVTHVYRRSPSGKWRLVHRHADYAQPDPRQTP